MKHLFKYLIITSLFISTNIHAQVWTQVGNGIVENPYWNSDVSSFESNGIIYVAFAEVQFPGPIYTAFVKQWNGIVWQNYPSINDFIPSDIIEHNGKIYISGKKTSGAQDIAFYEFDNNQWIAHAPTGFNGETITLASSNSNLFVGGSFTTSSAISHIFSWDGSSYNSFPALGSTQVYVKHIEEFNGEIHVAGPANPSVSVEGIYKWDGSNWVSLTLGFSGVSGPTFSNNFEHMFQFQNDLYCSVGLELYRIENDTAYYVDDLIRGLLDSKEGAGIMYLGDTTKLSVFDGNTVRIISNSPSSSGLELVNGELYSFGPRGFYQNIFSNANAYKTSLSHGVFSGETFFDSNGNCSKDWSELILKYILINIAGQQIGVSDNLGQFNFLVPAGTYNVNWSQLSSRLNKNFAITCSIPNSINISNGQVYHQDLPFSNPVANDLSVKLYSGSGWRSRQGFTERMYIHVENLGNSPQQNVEVEVKLPSTVVFKTSNATGHSITGNKLKFDLGDIQPYAISSLWFDVEIPVATNPLLSKLYWTSAITIPTVDADPLDNYDTLVTTVRAACDPNDKTPSDTAILPGTTAIDYHIRFQNTGTDTAYNIVVVDSLELNIPITSVIMNGSSHDYKLRVENNILIWEFDNILLPDSTTDLQGSQGFINFSTSINPNLAVGDTVQNQVQIYFDYQKPVFTNKAKTAVVKWIGEEENLVERSFDVYPNPANDFIYIENLGAFDSEILLYNAESKLLQKYNLKTQAKDEINIRKLEPGVYFLISGESQFKLIIQ
tara:strand:- start:32419 stop:34752 length:2334 start_codon:yes stop_codon:yes gene_type:complete